MRLQLRSVRLRIPELERLDEKRKGLAALKIYGGATCNCRRAELTRCRAWWT